jgi:hypothetical protein
VTYTLNLNSTLFHFDMAGAKWQTVISARFHFEAANSAFRARLQ